MATSSLQVRMLPILRGIVEAFGRKEYSNVVSVMHAVQREYKRGSLSRKTFLRACQVKSRMTLWTARKETATRIESLTRQAFATTYEKRRLEKLVELKGVNVPTASAILALADPARYGMIDIRVWQTLNTLGFVRKKPEGKTLSKNDWAWYTFWLRQTAGKLGVTPRQLDVALYEYHKAALQDGPLRETRFIRKRR